MKCAKAKSAEKNELKVQKGSKIVKKFYNISMATIHAGKAEEEEEVSEEKLFFS